MAARTAWAMLAVAGVAGSFAGWQERARAEAGKKLQTLPVRLVQDPAVSPGGKHIAFSWRGDVWIVGIRGGRARPLTTHPAIDLP